MTESRDVVIIGAGLTGLVAARVLSGAGLDVVVLDTADAPGGRIRTDRVDGMLLDRGFQLLNPKYPQAARTFNLRALRLHPFEAGAVVAHGTGRHVVADPRRMPGEAFGALWLPLGSLREKVAFARWAARVGYGPAEQIKRSEDSSLDDELRRRGIDGALADGVLRTFLAGVLGEDELRTSRRLAELLVRSFVRGTPALPENGMQAVPEQLAALIPEDALRLSTAALALDGTSVHSTAGVLTARAVVVATDARAAAELLHSSPPRTRALTTFYHLAPESPARRKMLHLDADRRGPIVNSAVLTDVAPSYAPGRVLVRRRSSASTRPPRWSARCVGTRRSSTARTPPAGSRSPRTRSRTRCPTLRPGPRSGSRSRSATASTSPATTGTRHRSRVRSSPAAASRQPCGAL